MSNSSLVSGRGNAIGTVIPPWEQRSIPQVPYVDASSPALSDAERKALPDLWAIRSHTISRHRPSTSTGKNLSTPQWSAPLPPLEGQIRSWNKDTDALFTSVPLQFSAPAPYETQVYRSQGRKIASLPPQVPQLATGAPPTPPDSLASSSEFSTTNGLPDLNHVITALPGTMSSRSRTPSRIRAKASTRGQNVSKKDKDGSVNFRRRWGSAFKDMFKRNPVDESQYEHLKDRHWTEE